MFNIFRSIKDKKKIGVTSKSISDRSEILRQAYNSHKPLTRDEIKTIALELNDVVSLFKPLRPALIAADASTIELAQIALEQLLKETEGK